MGETDGTALRGIGLLERAVGYLLGSLHLVTPAALSRETPCRDWDLRALLEHVDDSLLALREAAERGEVAAAAAPCTVGRDGIDLVGSVRNGAGQLVGSWLGVAATSGISVDGLPLTAGVVCGAGAVEIATHGWDVAEACGHRRVIPPSLADELADLAAVVVTDADRPRRFEPPVPQPPAASPSDRLVAFLGRDPRLTLTNCGG